MLVIGLTGGIASGKSTVSKELAQQGIRIIDADVIAREVVEPGRKAYKAVVEAFHMDVTDLLDECGKLNRPALGKAVFGNSQRLKTLNTIVHGAVRREIVRQLIWTYISGASMVILDVPLLFEAGLHRICGVTVVVSTNKELQLKRLLERNPELSQKDAQERILSQLSTEERNAKADQIIENNGTLESLKLRVNSVVKDLRPNKVWTVLDWFPPFGALVAVTTIMVRFIKENCEMRVKSNSKSD